MLARIAIDQPIGEAGGFLDYKVPPEWEQKVQIGLRVQAPLGRGNRPIQGYVTALMEQEDETSYKALTALLDDTPLLDAPLVQLAQWVAKRYLCSCYYVLEYILPRYARRQKIVSYRWIAEPEVYACHQVFLDEKSQTIADYLQKKGSVPKQQLLKKFAGAEEGLAELCARELCLREETFAENGSERQVVVYQSLVTPEALSEERVAAQVKRAPKQKELLWYLTYEGPREGGELRRKWPNAAELLKQLQHKKLISAETHAIQRTGETAEVFYNTKEIILNDEQQQAVDALTGWLEQGRYQPVLLQGVTGSGKTEVYLKAIEKTLAMGKGAMVLVPEIALTPQLIGRFKGRLQAPVEVLHSNLSDGERYDVWQNLRSGRIKVVVGVRSAVFAPVQDLGLIIMDEEHESTFKQSEPDPRYHARDVAMERARQSQAVLVLGSATPSVETYYRAQTGELAHLVLKQRAKQQPLPEVEIIDMSKAFRQGERQMFSLRLQAAMEEHLRRGEQIILFLNRRGFARSVLCRECGHTITCPKCSIAMTYHKQQNVLKCHYCDTLLPVPQKCPQCGSRFIRHFGSGTELVAEELLKLWPWLKVVRMDRDTTQNKNAHQQILETFAKGEAQVLIGTQMVTKGLDFPNVTLVGVIAADLTLNMPDYSAAERCFQLLTQVAGRAGRGDKTGEVIVQTYNSSHYSILAAQKHDYEAFYDQEIKNRQLMDYPPFAYIIRILLSDFKADEPTALLAETAAYLSQRYPAVEFFGPAEAPIEKIRGRYRVHLLLKGHSLPELLEAAECGEKYMNVSRKSKTLRIIIDVEPQSIL